MRQSFDQKVPEEVQRQRIVKTHTGHKHRKRAGPGAKAEAIARKAKGLSEAQSAREKKYRSAVADFFRGDRDSYPGKKK